MGSIGLAPPYYSILFYSILFYYSQNTTHLGHTTIFFRRRPDKGKCHSSLPYSLVTLVCGTFYHIEKLKAIESDHAYNKPSFSSPFYITLHFIKLNYLFIALLYAQVNP